ncbi:2OG-Fe(II) oxygenase [Xylogone sp. PMI_703]|nr:2OG-Fe(II) oxygenase [Xylogone sp. PMI_703]
MYKLSKLSIFSSLAGVLPILLFAANRYQTTTTPQLHENSCPPPKYTSRILSWDPLMIHLENFITPEEIQHLLELPHSMYKRSQVIYKNGSTSVHEGRTSSTASLTRTNNTIARCIQERAAEFQGFDTSSTINVQATRYEDGQYFRAHYDWNISPVTGLVQPTTTFFATIQADCENCGTEFPLLKYNWTAEDPRVCEYVDCESETMIIRPRVGSAIFWRNINKDGTGHNSTLHAGLPVTGGKIGLNIWTMPAEQ